MAIDIKVDSAKLLRVLNAAPKELDRAMVAVGHRIGQRFLGYHRARRMRGPPGVKATRKGLISHFGYEVKGTDMNRLHVQIGTRSRVALEHEEGRTLVPKYGRGLLVPLKQNGKEMTRAQLRRARALLKARQLIEVRSASGQRLLGERRRRSGPLNLLFAIVKRVKLRPLLAFLPTWREYMRSGAAIKIFNTGLSHALSAARRKARAG